MNSRTRAESPPRAGRNLEELALRLDSARARPRRQRRPGRSSKKRLIESFEHLQDAEEGVEPDLVLPALCIFLFMREGPTA